MQVDLNTQIRLLEEHFAKLKEQDFEIDEAKKVELKKVLCNIKSRWKASCYALNPFYKKNEKWLDTSVTLKVKTRRSYNMNHIIFNTIINIIHSHNNIICFIPRFRIFGLVLEVHRLIQEALVDRLVRTLKQLAYVQKNEGQMKSVHQ